jgi:hypothetical protein
MPEDISAGSAGGSSEFAPSPQDTDEQISAIKKKIGTSENKAFTMNLE